MKLRPIHYALLDAVKDIPMETGFFYGRRLDYHTSNAVVRLRHMERHGLVRSYRVTKLVLSAGGGHYPKEVSVWDITRKGKEHLKNECRRAD